MHKSIRYLLPVVRWGLSVGLALSGVVHAASFNCAKAQTQVEKMICSDVELTKLDKQLGQAWKRHLRDNKFQDQFRNTQKQWMGHRNECADAECLKQTYQARLQQMATGKEYFLRDGEGEPLCQSVVKAMNEELYRPGHGRVCAFDILQRLPGVLLPPWKKLDLQRDKELYKKFVLADHAWEELWPAAFSDPPPKAGQPIDPKSKHSAFPMPSDEELNREWAYAVEAGFEFYRWDNAIPLPEHSDDSVLIRTTKLNDGNCQSTKTQLFTSDLKKPKPYPLHSFGGGVSFSYGEKWYWLTGVVNNASLTDAFTIGQLNSVAKNYIHLMDVCKVTDSQKSFKWE